MARVLLRARSLVLAGFVVLGLVACGDEGARREVSDISVDLIGNSIKVSSFADPQVQGVHCYVSNFERGLIDRLAGVVGSAARSPFIDPRNASITCVQISPEIRIGRIDTSGKGEAILSESTSLIFRHIQVRRVYDSESASLLYVTVGTAVIEGSAKSSITAVPLTLAKLDCVPESQSVCDRATQLRAAASSIAP